MSPLDDHHHDQFLRLFAEQEPALRTFTRLLLPSRNDVSGVMQEVAVTLWHREPTSELPVLAAQSASVEDMDLLTDSEALDLMEGGDGSFYEWAAAQAENGASDG